MDEAVKFLASKIGYTITVILGFIIPGVMFVFVWKRELFLELEIIKLIILGFGIAFALYIPLLIMSTGFMMVEGKLKDKKYDLSTSLLVPVALNVSLMVLVMTIKIVNNAYSMLDFVKEFGVPIVFVIIFLGVLILLPDCVWDFFKKVNSFIKNILKIK